MDNPLDNVLVGSGAMLLTKEYGYINIASVYLTNIHVWNGEDYIPTKVNINDHFTEVYSVNFNSKLYPQVGPNFKFLMLDDDTDETLSKKTTELKFGDYVIPFKRPTDINGLIIDNNILQNISYLRVCDVRNHKRKERMYYLDYTNSDRFMISGVMTGIS